MKVIKFSPTATEWCPNCDTEVELSYSTQQCPNCGVVITCCSMCNIGDIPYPDCSGCQYGSKFILHRNVDKSTTEEVDLDLTLPTKTIIPASPQPKRVAKIVTVSVSTRVVVNDTTSDEDTISVAIPRLAGNLYNDGVFDHLVSIKDDTEIPYEALETGT